MKRKKQFVSPQVLKQVEVCLEKDMLVGASMQYHAEISSVGSILEVMDFTPDGEGVENSEGYGVYWDE